MREAKLLPAQVKDRTAENNLQRFQCQKQYLQSLQAKPDSLSSSKAQRRAKPHPKPASATHELRKPLADCNLRLESTQNEQIITAALYTSHAPFSTVRAGSLGDEEAKDRTETEKIGYRGCYTKAFSSLHTVTMLHKSTQPSTPIYSTVIAHIRITHAHTRKKGYVPINPPPQKKN